LFSNQIQYASRLPNRSTYGTVQLFDCRIHIYPTHRYPSTQPNHSKGHAGMDYYPRMIFAVVPSVIPAVNPSYSSLCMIIAYTATLLRVKNSTAFATDDEFDRNKGWIVRSWCGGGTGMRTGQTCWWRKSFCVGLCVWDENSNMRAPDTNEPNGRYCGAEERGKGMLPEQTERGKVSL
jgi:hypothetical protein